MAGVTSIWYASWGRVSTLAGQKMDEWGWASVLIWISWPLWVSAEHFAMASSAFVLKEHALGVEDAISYLP